MNRTRAWFLRTVVVGMTVAHVGLVLRQFPASSLKDGNPLCSGDLGWHFASAVEGGRFADQPSKIWGYSPTFMAGYPWGLWNNSSFGRGGDSLLGRYRFYRLHPFSLREFAASKPAEWSDNPLPPVPDFPHDAVPSDLLFAYGGFPEPLLHGTARVHRRWKKERFERIFREDIRDTEQIREFAQIELLGAMLPDRVGSPFSMLSVAGDIEVSPKTIRSWMERLCRNYYCYRVPPWHRRLDRALKKESKYYLWDWSEIEDKGRRFENMVGSHLLKFCHFQEDVFGHSVNLYYVRDAQKREVDFLVVWKNRPWMFVECALKAGHKTAHLQYFGEKLNVRERYLVTLDNEADYTDKKTGVRVIPAGRFLMAFV